MILTLDDVLMVKLNSTISSSQRYIFLSLLFYVSGSYITCPSSGVTITIYIVELSGHILPPPTVLRSGGSCQILRDVKRKSTPERLKSSIKLLYVFKFSITFTLQCKVFATRARITRPDKRTRPSLRELLSKATTSESRRASHIRGAYSGRTSWSQLIFLWETVQRYQTWELTGLTKSKTFVTITYLKRLRRGR